MLSAAGSCVVIFLQAITVHRLKGPKGAIAVAPIICACRGFFCSSILLLSIDHHFQNKKITWLLQSAVENESETADVP